MLRKGHCEGMKRHRRGTNTLRRPSFASFPPSFPPTFLPFSLPFSLPYLQRRLQHRLQRALVRGLARVHKLDELRHVHRTMARLAPPPSAPAPSSHRRAGQRPRPSHVREHELSVLGLDHGAERREGPREVVAVQTVQLHHRRQLQKRLRDRLRAPLVDGHLQLPQQGLADPQKYLST